MLWMNTQVIQIEVKSNLYITETQGSHKPCPLWAGGGFIKVPILSYKWVEFLYIGVAFYTTRHYAINYQWETCDYKSLKSHENTCTVCH